MQRERPVRVWNGGAIGRDGEDVSNSVFGDGWSRLEDGVVQQHLARRFVLFRRHIGK